MARLGWGVGALFALSVACGGGSSDPAPPVDDGGGGGGGGGGDGGGDQIVIKPPIVAGDFAFYGADQGFDDVWDVSADEGGNVYVAGGDAVFAKRRDDVDFQRFGPAKAGLTTNCSEDGTVACPIVAVAGAAPGKAIVGFRGVGTDGDLDPEWQLNSGGADVLAFDGTSVTRARHVQVAGTPEQMCDNDETPSSELQCIGDKTWTHGRRKVRQVLRFAVNHDASAPHYGDVWMTGSHGSFSLLVANPEARGWVDRTPQYPGTQDRQYVWEHDHPAPYLPATIGGVWRSGAFLTGDDNTAIALDPTTGDPWAANLVRAASKKGYAKHEDGTWNRRGWNVAMWPPYLDGDQLRSWLDVWPDPDPATVERFDALDPAYLDAIRSMSFCDDGTLWMASGIHGLARRAPDGTISYLSLPTGLGNSAWAVACDPSDASIWVGFGWGGFGRYKDGKWWLVPTGVPAFAYQSPVRNIQIDRWSSPRVVYFAHAKSKFGPGGVVAYDGP